MTILSARTWELVKVARVTLKCLNVFFCVYLQFLKVIATTRLFKKDIMWRNFSWNSKRLSSEKKNIFCVFVRELGRKKIATAFWLYIFFCCELHSHFLVFNSNLYLVKERGIVLFVSFRLISKLRENGRNAICVT